MSIYMNLGIDNWVAWFSVFVQYILCNGYRVLFIRRIYTFDELFGPKTGLCLLWC